LLLMSIILAIISSCSRVTGSSTSTMPTLPHDQIAETRVPITHYAPQEDDQFLIRGIVFIETVDLLMMESHPQQFSLALVGSLPDPCHEMRVQIFPPNEINTIILEIYSIVDPGELCIQVMAPFSATIPLGTFSAGHYHLVINGDPVMEFDSK